MQLVHACADPGVPVDESAVTALIEHATGSKKIRQYALPKSEGATGAFLEFDTRITFSRLLEYSFNPYIPAAVTRPSSLRYSLWVNPKGGQRVLPISWRPVPSDGPPVIIHGMQRESDSPDIHSGAYHEYDLKRLLVLVNYKGRQALVSVSKQNGPSGVGKKAFTLGDDNDWIYYYTDEPGTTKKGIGWAKSFIYDYFSVGVYVESAPGQPGVHCAAMQWLRAGWSGINFVRSNHIIDGLKRFSQTFNEVLESPRLPAPGQIAGMYQSLVQLSPTELLDRYSVFQQKLRSSAFRMGKISKLQPVDRKSFVNVSKEQMAEELMVDYIRIALGKRPLTPALSTQEGQN